VGISKEARLKLKKHIIKILEKHSASSNYITRSILYDRNNNIKYKKPITPSRVGHLLQEMRKEGIVDYHMEMHHNSYKVWALIVKEE
jgi:hypothetical protein